jgi:acetoacetate decarboxylase
LATIDVRVDPEAVVGTLARPSDCPLASVIVSPAERLPAEILDAFLPSGTPFYSLRHLPGPEGATQVHELIRWNCDLAVRKDAFGDDLRFTGPGSVTYPTRSAVDPVHRLGVDTFVAAAYLEFDMRLTAGKCVWSETVAAATAQVAEPAGAPA